MTHPKPAAGNPVLRQLYEQDQADRRQTNWGVAVDQRDAVRRRRVGAILAADSARTGADFYHAAMVFQHGDDSTSHRQAHELAVRAEQLGEPRARWLAAASLDRYLLSTGRPQRYGTQWREVGGQTYLDRIDTTAVSDDERRRAGVPTLAEIRATLQQKNHSATASLAPPPEAAHPEETVELIGTLAELGRQVQYPAAARTANVAGKVKVELTVQPDGTVSEATVINGLGYGLDEEVLRLVKAARFRNTTGAQADIRLLVPVQP